MGVDGIQTQSNYFDAQAATWDEKPHRVARVREVGEAIVREICPTSDMDVLDYGCGTGMLAFFLLPHVQSVTGADNSSGMLEVFRQKIEADYLDRMKGVDLDLVCDAVPEDRFHLIVSNMVFHHMADTEAMLQKFYQLLHPGGVVCISDLDTEPGNFHNQDAGETIYHSGFDRDELKQQFIGQGFRNVRDSTAHIIYKEIEGVGQCEFPVFLIWGER